MRNDDEDTFIVDDDFDYEEIGLTKKSIKREEGDTELNYYNFLND